jgi:hypothetical protein
MYDPLFALTFSIPFCKCFCILPWCEGKALATRTKVRRARLRIQRYDDIQLGVTCFWLLHLTYLICLGFKLGSTNLELTNISIIIIVLILVLCSLVCSIERR